MVFEEAVVVTSGEFADVLAAVKAELAAEGFGTLTEIDVQQTLADKIGKQMQPYTIVGACNPHLAGRAIDAVPQIGTLLPCNVVVRQSGEDVIVEALDPGLMATVSGSDELAPLGTEARELIGRALGRLASA